MAFSPGINGDGVRKYKKTLNILIDKLYKKHSLERSSTPVLYVGCMAPKG